MAISDYDTNPANNTVLSGIPVTDNTAVNAVDDLVRQLMADTREEYDISRSDAALDNVGATDVGKAVLKAANKAVARDATLEPITAVDASAGAQVVNLPAASTMGASGYLVYIRTDNTTNTATLTPDGSDTINGLNSMLIAPGALVTLFSDGTSAWYSTPGEIVYGIGAYDASYRISGMTLECWGQVAGNASGLVAISFPKGFASPPSFQVTAIADFGTAADQIVVAEEAFNSMSPATGVSASVRLVSTAGVTASGADVRWMAKGKWDGN